MGVIENLLGGFAVALGYEALLFCLLGVTVGTFVGALPGVGAVTAISISLPLTFYMDPAVALIMLAGIFYGSQYGSSISSILLNVPGTSTAAVTCLDGYPMAQKGKAGVALFVTTVSSFIGGSIAILLLILFAPAIAQLALRFSSPEYFAIMILGLIAASTLSTASPVRGLMMLFFGLALSAVGTDVTSGEHRLTFGLVQLRDGISLVALAMGLFGLAEIAHAMGRRQPTQVPNANFSFLAMIPSRSDFRASILPTLRGTAIGSAIGALPGTGPTIASFMAYAAEVKLSKTPERFGQGAIEGVTSPEAANNAAVQTAFIPTLSLGLPGDSIMAILLGAMMIHGIIPGPQLVSQHPDIFWGLIASFWIGNIALVVLNIPLIGLWVKLLSVPHRLLYPMILALICIGVYSVNYSLTDVVTAILFGAVGYGMVLFNYPPAPVLLGFVLGPLLEEHFRRSMIISRGDLEIFLTRPVSAGFLLLALVIVVYAISRWVRGRSPGA